LTLDGYVASGEQWILYLGVSNVDPNDVVEAASGRERIERARVIGGGADDHGRVELVLGASELLHTVTAAGASARTATITPDQARLTLEAPAEIDVRELVERLRSDYPGTDLLSREKLDRDVQPMGQPETILDELTGRQRDALEAAYRAGYFGWPRETTAEEVAESLDLTPPTLHGHLRKAEYAILSKLLDGS
jgi:DNA-binding transcriptional ArsR family regulator